MPLWTPMVIAPYSVVLSEVDQERPINVQFIHIFISIDQSPVFSVLQQHHSLITKSK